MYIFLSGSVLCVAPDGCGARGHHYIMMFPSWRCFDRLWLLLPWFPAWCVCVCLCFVFSNLLDHLVWFTCEQTLWSFLLWTSYQQTTVISYVTRLDECHCLHTICNVKFNNEFFLLFCNCTFYLLHWSWMMKEWTTPDPSHANSFDVCCTRKPFILLKL